jgi:hypothetical protein
MQPLRLPGVRALTSGMHDHAGGVACGLSPSCCLDCLSFWHSFATSWLGALCHVPFASSHQAYPLRLGPLSHIHFRFNPYVIFPWFGPISHTPLGLMQYDNLIVDPKSGLTRGFTPYAKFSSLHPKGHIPIV